MGGPEVEAFLNHLASERHLSASSQTQALNALVFLYDSVLQQPLGEMAGLKRVQRRHRVPVVLSREEVKAILGQMAGVVRLMAELMYGSGLRVNECMTLRVKDIDFSGGVLNVRSGKGGKDRTTLLPERLHAPLKQQLLRVASGTDIRTIQLLLGHRSLQTTMIYTHVIEVTRSVASPFDSL